MNGTGLPGSDGNAVSSPAAAVGAAFAAAAVAVSIFHWFPFLSLLFAAPLFFIRFRYGNRAFLLSLPAVVILDSVLTGATLGATGGLTANALGLSALGTALVAFPLAALALPFLRRDEYRLAAAAFVSALLWAGLALFTPLGREVDDFIRDFAAQSASFFREALNDLPDSSLLVARLSEENLYGIARKTVSWSVFPAPFIAYAAGWRMGRFAVSLARPRRLPVFSLEGFYTGFPVFVPLALGMMGVIANRFAPNGYLETVSWNAIFGSGFPLILQGYGITRSFVRRLSQRGKRPYLWIGPLLILVVVTVGWPYVLSALMILGAVELFVPIRRRLIDKGVVDPTPGRGGDQNKE